MNLSRSTPSEELANIFINTIDKESIIAEIFNFFRFSPMARCNDDPGKIDNPIKDFIASGYSDINTLVKIIEIVRKGSENSEKQEKELVEKIKLITESQLNEDISIEEIAASLHVSYYYLCHIFKEQTGMSINTYKNSKRIEKAMKELVSTDMNISEIAVSCGFNNTSYFSKVFTKFTGMSPTQYKAKVKNAAVHSFYNLNDMLLLPKMENMSFISKNISLFDSNLVDITTVNDPDDKFKFLHETAIIEFKGVLYASWYECPENELMGYTPVVSKRSYDGGKTWSEKEIIARDKTEKILFCPPVYGIDGDKLYMFINEMVAPDHMHALDLYVLDEESGKFKFLWSRPIPFKLNTNVVKLPNGKLMLPGRITELDSFPNTPAVLISDSGKIDSEWRLVKIAENGDLKDGSRLIHPELSVIVNDGILYMFSRNDMRHIPLVYVSKDMGESWSEEISHDIPFVSTKVYAGTLNCGRHFLVCNIDNPDRSKLSVYFTEKGSVKFTKQIVLFDRENEMLPEVSACHYPAAVEYDNKLYVIATKNFNTFIKRGAALFTIDLNKI